MLRNVSKLLSFLVVLLLIFNGLNGIFLMKGQSNTMNKYSSYNYYNPKVLYSIDKNTLDAVFIGASQTYMTVLPLEIWEKYGITSINLAFTGVGMDDTYFIAKEVFKYQNPKVLFVDAGGLRVFPDNNYATLSWMKPSLNKYQAFCNAYKLEKTSYNIMGMWDIFLNHDSWEKLNKYNFIDYTKEFDYMKNSFYNPSTVSISLNYKENYISFPVDTAIREMMEKQASYLKKIRELCDSNNCKMVVFKAPAFNWSQEYSMLVQKYCENLNIEFLDYANEAWNLGLDESKWFYDFSENDLNGHLSYEGAKIISYYFGDYLRKCGIVNKKDDSDFENWNKDYQQFLYDKDWMDFQAITDLDTYLEKVSDSPYLLLVSAKDEALNGLTEQNLTNLERLGLELSLDGMNQASYIAAVQQKKVFAEKLNETGEIREEVEMRGNRISLFSAGWINGGASEIVINGDNYSQNLRGINLVLYDPYTEKVIDSVVFDTHLDGQAQRVKKIPIG